MNATAAGESQPRGGHLEDQRATARFEDLGGISPNAVSRSSTCTSTSLHQDQIDRAALGRSASSADALVDADSRRRPRVR